MGDPGVGAVFDASVTEVRARLLELRQLIFTAAAVDPRVGKLTETLKWGQAAYLPATPRIGTTVRIAASTGRPGDTTVFFHCQTSLLPTFRELYPDVFDFDGARALHFAGDQPLPRAALQHCLGLALTYHLAKRVPAA